MREGEATKDERPYSHGQRATTPRGGDDQHLDRCRQDPTNQARRRGTTASDRRLHRARRRAVLEDRRERGGRRLGCSARPPAPAIDGRRTAKASLAGLLLLPSPVTPRLGAQEARDGRRRWRRPLRCRGRHRSCCLGTGHLLEEGTADEGDQQDDLDAECDRSHAEGAKQAHQFDLVGVPSAVQFVSEPTVDLSNIIDQRV